jgi:hypothetical protein
MCNEESYLQIVAGSMTTPDEPLQICKIRFPSRSLCMEARHVRQGGGEYHWVSVLVDISCIEINKWSLKTRLVF